MSCKMCEYMNRQLTERFGSKQAFLFNQSIEQLVTESNA